MELFTLLIFCAVLLLCVVLKLSVLYALGAGVLIFCLYGRRKGFSWGQLGKMLLDGAATAKNVVFIVGMMGIVAGCGGPAAPSPISSAPPPPLCARTPWC